MMINTISDIFQYPILVTTCEKNVSRVDDLTKQIHKVCNNADIHVVVGPINDKNYTIGVAQGYIEALSKFEPPFVVFEDDARLVLPNVPKMISPLGLPDNADALYIGTSIMGRLNGQTKVCVIAARVNNVIDRVFNMLSLHGIVYFSKTYVDHIISLMQSYIADESLNSKKACDDLIAEAMWAYQVYALRFPLFYQRDRHNEQATMLSVRHYIAG